jgi:hypothetical protein
VGAMLGRMRTIDVAARRPWGTWVGWAARGVRVTAFLASALLILFPGASRAALSRSAPVFVNDGSWSRMTAVACPSFSQCTAVDAAGREVTFDPGSPRGWSAYTIDARRALSALACPAVSQCTAVDGSGQEVTFDPNSTIGWTRFVIDPGHSLQGVACPSVSQCMGADDGGRVVTFDPAAPEGAVAAHGRCDPLGDLLPVSDSVHRGRQRALAEFGVRELAGPRDLQSERAEQS